jgi:hypothetical protein
MFHVGQCVPVWTASFAERLKICIIGLRKTSLLELLGFRTFYISWHSKQNTACHCEHWSPPPVIDQLLLHSVVSFDHAWQHDASWCVSWYLYLVQWTVHTASDRDAVFEKPEPKTLCRSWRRLGCSLADMNVWPCVKIRTTDALSTVSIFCLTFVRSVLQTGCPLSQSLFNFRMLCSTEGLSTVTVAV